MKKNGFTFIEILGVITLLALMSIIVLIVVDDSLKKSKETLSEAQIENIRSAASMWRTDNIEVIPDNGYYTLTLGELIDSGYIDEVIDPNSKNNYDRNLIVRVNVNDILIDQESSIDDITDDDILIKAGYIKLEYIESTGTQYIMTDIVPSDDMGVMLKVSSMDINNDLIYLGSKGSGNTRFWIGNSGVLGGSVYYGWNFYTASENRPVITANTINEIKMNYLNDRQNIFNNVVKEYILETLGNNPYPIAVFGGNSAGTVSYKSKIRLYELKVSKANEIKYNFIPCMRKSDDVIGLYDIVNNVFYTNSGTGEFVKGEL